MSKNPIDPKVKKSLQLAFAVLGWVVVTTALGLLFGFILEDVLGWESHYAGMVGVFLWLIVFVGAPAAFAALYFHLAENEEIERVQSERQEEKLRKKQEEAWHDGYIQAQDWNRRTRIHPDAEAPVNPYMKGRV